MDKTELYIPTEIMRQLGGRMFIAMTGAKNMVYDTNSVFMKIGKNSKGVSHFRVTLDPNDTYTVEFFSYSKMNLKLKSSFSGVYCDQLVDIFEGSTGLYCTL